MIGVLLKKQLLSFLYAMRNGGNRKKKKATNGVLMVCLFVFLYFSLCAAFFGISLLLGDTLFPAEEFWLYFAVLGTIAFLFGVVGSVFSTYSWLYRAKDNDLLLSMPLKPSAILASRMISVCGMALLYASVVMLPGSVYFWIRVPCTLATVLFPVLTLLSLTAAITAVGCLLGWVVALIGTRVRSPKVLTVFFVLLALGAYYVFAFRMQQVLNSLVAHLNDIAAFFRQKALPLWALGSAAAGDPLCMLGWLGCSALLLLLVWRLLAVNFTRIVTMRRGGKRVVWNREKAKEIPVERALFRREWRHFIGSTAYMLNCGLGTVLLPVACVVLAFKMEDLTPLLGLLPELRMLMPLLVLLLLCFLSGMNMITACSVSLDARHRWMLCSMPVPVRKILNAKQMLHLVLTLPPVLFCGVVLCTAAQVSVPDAVLVVAASLVFVFFESAFGLCLNLRWQNTTWTNETQAVKSGFATVIALFGSWVLLIALGVAAWFLRDALPVRAYAGLFLTVFAALTVLLNRWIDRRGADLF